MIFSISLVSILSGCTTSRVQTLHEGTVVITGDTNSALDKQFVVEIYDVGNYTIIVNDKTIFNDYIDSVPRKFVHPMSWGQHYNIEVIKDGIKEVGEASN